ncbi:MAG: hypothetical protein DSM106950_36880 [Stigonema ocellatum SAG 48.90 = DSM 106950]|nr:hypothetical protein [Stigonema ocellatum SAG 48.90 = DSM 106950]
MNKNHNSQPIEESGYFQPRVRDQERELKARISSLNKAVFEYAVSHGQYQRMPSSKNLGLRQKSSHTLISPFTLDSLWFGFTILVRKFWY